MSVLEKNYCPLCGSEDTKESHLTIQKNILDALYAWTEYICNKCGTKYVDGKLVIVKGDVQK